MFWYREKIQEKGSKRDKIEKKLDIVFDAVFMRVPCDYGRGGMCLG